MSDEVREIGKKPPISEVKNITGYDVEDFLKANIPTGRELSEEEKGMFMRKRKVARITIIIKAESGKAETTKLEDVFNLHLIFDKRGDNAKVLNQRLEQAKGLCQELITKWEKEI
jgi:hypothetical protein